MLCYAYVGTSNNIFTSLSSFEILEKISAFGFVWEHFGKLFLKISFSP